MTKFLEPLIDFSEAARSCQNGEELDTILERYVALRDKKNLTKLYEEFIEAFGDEGEKIASNPSKAIYFNGGSDPTEPDKYFPGLHFSLPLLAYVMRRALNTDTEEEAYHKYIKNVDRLVKERNEDAEKHNNKIRDAYYADKDPFEHDAHVLIYSQQKGADANTVESVPAFEESLVVNAYPSRNMIEKLCAPTLRALDNVLQKEAVQDTLKKMDDDILSDENSAGAAENRSTGPET